MAELRPGSVTAGGPRARAKTPSRAGHDNGVAAVTSPGAGTGGRGGELSSHARSHAGAGCSGPL